MSLKLLTPGPISTTVSVKEAMLDDVGTRDSDYATIVQNVNDRLLTIADANNENYASVLLQGSGTYCVESVFSSCIGGNDKLLILSNGSYGYRMKEIAQQIGINHEYIAFSSIHKLPINEIEQLLTPDITHVGFVHHETTAGVMNNLEALVEIVSKYKKTIIVDAISSFGAYPMSLDNLKIDYVIASSNKCLHGVPGIGIIFAKKETLEKCKGISRSYSLDLYEQYITMEEINSFRFTSPTHVVLALQQALIELEAEGVEQRFLKYKELQSIIANFMTELGFELLVSREEQSPYITTFLIPKNIDFQHFYKKIKEQGFLLYSGKIPEYHAFRIGNIGDLSRSDIQRLQCSIESYIKEFSNGY